MLSRYLELLRTRPLATNSASALVVAVSGDFLCQQIEDKYVAERSLKMGLWGALWMGPSATVWFRWLEVFGFGAKGVAIKVFLNQTIMAPTTNALFYLYNESWTRPHSTIAERYRRRMEKEFLPTMMTSVCVWVPTQTINFALVPPFLRPLFLNVAFVLWTAHLSYRGHRSL